MASNGGPVERLKLKRKDGMPSTGTNRDGSTYENTHVEVGAIWASDRGKSMTLAPGFTLCYNGKPIADSWLNVFEAGSKGPGRKQADADEDF